MEHLLRIKEPFLTELVSGRKTFELRYNDRGYQTGDTLIFNTSCLEQPHDCEECREAGKIVEFEITYVLSGFGLKEGYVVLGVVKKKVGN